MAPGHSIRQPPSAQAWKPFVLQRPNAATNASCAASGATGHERAPNDGKPGKADETTSPHPLPHDHQQEATSAIPQPPGHPRATPRQPPLNDSKISHACTKPELHVKHQAQRTHLTRAHKNPPLPPPSLQLSFFWSPCIYLHGFVPTAEEFKEVAFRL